MAHLLYGMGRDGVLPKPFFGFLNSRFQTPILNIALCGLIVG